VSPLAGIFAASALCYAPAARAAWGRERTLGEDYVLLLGALLFSSGRRLVRVQFHVFGTGWSRHLPLPRLAPGHGLSVPVPIALTVALTASPVGSVWRRGPARRTTRCSRYSARSAACSRAAVLRR
jgi:hypothetical protein